MVKPMIIDNPSEWVREIVATGAASDMREFEVEVLELFDAKNDSRSFNKHNGGKFSHTGCVHTSEIRAKISLALRGKKRDPRTPEHQAKLTKSHTGKKMPPEMGKKIAAIQLGRKHSEEHRKNISLANKGRHITAEHRVKLSEANKGKTFSLERCAAVSAGHLNMTDEKKYACKVAIREARNRWSEEKREFISNKMRQSHQMRSTEEESVRRSLISIAMKGKPWSEARRAACNK